MTTADYLNYADAIPNQPEPSRADQIKDSFDGVATLVVDIKSKFSTLAFRMAGIRNQNNQDDFVHSALRWDKLREEYVSLVNVSLFRFGILNIKIDNLVNFVFPTLTSEINLEVKISIVMKAMESFEESKKASQEDIKRFSLFKNHLDSFKYDYSWLIRDSEQGSLKQNLTDLCSIIDGKMHGLGSWISRLMAADCQRMYGRLDYGEDELTRDFMMEQMERTNRDLEPLYKLIRQELDQHCLTLLKSSAL
ncbi:hypothetical protein B0H34DRAFT_728523 [Crassisporium funariophilum]|nr:hypothetical protein B0H34DRAFT_728523 [Crassisporium funariophilum]